MPGRLAACSVRVCAGGIAAGQLAASQCPCWVNVSSSTGMPDMLPWPVMLARCRALSLRVKTMVMS